MAAGEAADAARELLGDAHAAVASAVALWTITGLDRPRYEAWAAGLPPSVGRGAPPDQAGLDAWAQEHTSGLVERFPSGLEPDTVAVLATAVATRVRWLVSFGVCDAARLRSPWSERLEQVLVSSGGGHRAGVVSSAVGDVGVHAVTSLEDDLVVVSVIADAGRAVRTS